MTRTERSSHPRAIVKDRSESKSGLDKRVQKVRPSSPFPPCLAPR